MKPYNRPLAAQDSLDLTRTLMHEQGVMSSLTRSQIEKAQTLKLRAMLAYAKKNSPWYARTLSNIEPSIFTLKQLNTLPILTKRDIMDNWNDIVTRAYA